MAYYHAAGVELGVLTAHTRLLIFAETGYLRPVPSEQQGRDDENEEVSRESTPNEAESYLGQSSNLAYSHAARFELTSRPSSPPGGHAVQPKATTSNLEPPDISESKNNARRKKSKRIGDQSYLAFQEPSFTPLNLSRYAIPSTERGLEMSSWYFENASPTYRILHRPSIERAITSMCNDNEWLGGTAGNDPIPLDSVEECTVLMVWALACQYAVFPHGRKASSIARDWLQRKGREYYQVAELTLEKDKACLDKMSTLQVRLLMCLYLLTTSRLKSAWDLFAIVKNMANNLDLSRVQTSGGAFFKSSISPLNLELRKRTFWAIYTLDTYLCVMLGKSLTFDELEIRTPHPYLDDESISANTTQSEYELDTTPATGLSLMLCPLAHASLARIVRKTLRSLYLGPRADNDEPIVDSLATQISEWEYSLPEFLRLKSAVGLRDIYARQNTVIRLAQQHALMMIYRPALPLSGLAAKSIHAENMNGFLESPNLRIHQDKCLQAAFEAHNICTSLFKKGEVNDHYWFTSYILFCAATVMLVHVAHNPSGHQAASAWVSAQDCCKLERQVCHSNRLARRYVTALEDLSKQLKKRFPDAMSRILDTTANTYMHPGSTDVARTSQGCLTDLQLDKLSALPFSGDGINLEFGSNASPGSQWEQFLDPFLTNEADASFYHWDSLVSGGMDFGFS
ncbi:hypothetical protein CAC42_5803 [Sphaceloma murrayae]|uniref:Xylanolytic transcriptional activator regulatory domain-containing protein n=1 Tax=Sphaceloma murrayae TaxID=2082308 RepID=A0A2K1QZJ6_9PEZI|nr:hypothetical protein CAC42_5803 [Sphaceloma murrayae]